MPAAPAHSITRKRLHASRYSHRLLQLARQDRHGRRARPDRDQLRGLGHRRHFQGFGRSSLARIGGTEISIEQFRQLYSERLQQLGRQLGRPITLDQARQMGIDQQLVGQLIGEATLDERAKALRLSITDDEMARRITSNPELIGPTGQFDRHALRDDAAQQPDHRAALPRRTAPPGLAAAIGRHRAHRNGAAESRDGSGGALSERAAHGRICPARAGAGRRDPRADARTAREVSSKSARRCSAPRSIARSSCCRCCPASRRYGRRSPMRTSSAPMRSAARAISRPNAGRFSRSCSTIRRKRRPPPTASPRANCSSTSPRNASSPKRKSISAR